MVGGFSWGIMLSCFVLSSFLFLFTGKEKRKEAKEKEKRKGYMNIQYGALVRLYAYAKKWRSATFFDTIKPPVSGRFLCAKPMWNTYALPK